MLWNHVSKTLDRVMRKTEMQKVGEFPFAPMLIRMQRGSGKTTLLLELARKHKNPLFIAANDGLNTLRFYSRETGIDAARFTTIGNWRNVLKGHTRNTNPTLCGTDIVLVDEAFQFDPRSISDISRDASLGNVPMVLVGSGHGSTFIDEYEERYPMWVVYPQTSNIDHCV